MKGIVVLPESELRKARPRGMIGIGVVAGVAAAALASLGVVARLQW